MYGAIKISSLAPKEPLRGGIALRVVMTFGVFFVLGIVILERMINWLCQEELLTDL